MKAVLVRMGMIAWCCAAGCGGAGGPAPPGDTGGPDDLLSGEVIDDGGADDDVVDGETPGDDLSAPGIPAVKMSWLEGREIGLQSEQSAEAAFYYDEIDYFVASTLFHGTTVTVAMHNEAIATVAAPHSPEDFADAIFTIFHEAWHVFGGFPLDRYVFKIRDPDDLRDLELSRGGVVLDAADYDHLDQAHEIIHAWNGKTFQYVPDGSGNIFQLETWITEGSTIYLANIIDGEVIAGHYEGTMEALWAQYVERIGTEYDVPYAELAANGSATFMTGGEWNTMLGAKGNALNYLFDRELRAAGSSLPEVVQHLYANFGLTDTPFTQADVEDTVLALTGQRLEDFFERYLRTSAPLTEVLDGSFPRLE